jgi:hypothetical protein
MRRRTAGLEGVQGKEVVSPNSLADFLIGFQRLDPIFVKAIPTRSDGGLDRQFDSGAVSVFRFHGVRLLTLSFAFRKVAHAVRGRRESDE